MKIINDIKVKHITFQITLDKLHPHFFIFTNNIGIIASSALRSLPEY